MLLVDDWFKTGSQALTAVELIEAAGAEVVGASFVVDQLPEDVSNHLGRCSALIPYSALPDADPLA